MRLRFGAAAAAIAAIGAASASAEIVQEVRVGVSDHDLSLGNEGRGGKEEGVALSGEIVFATPGFLSWALKPRPYVSAHVNTAGDTSYVAAGLNWRAQAKAFHGEFGLGYAIHDGEVELPPNPSDPRRIELNNSRVILGSRDVFRVTGAIGVSLTPKWDAAIVYDHLSHGQILGSGKNEGLDQLGLRVSYKFRK